jgi:GH25 family lysozyme M1 (1,4-beta-N-acetylmuramidase)
VQLQFADISDYQDRFNAASYAAAGHTLVAIKATEGTGWVSATHAARCAAAHAHGLEVWHYHFAHPDTDPSEAGEAGHFWRTVRPHFHPGDRLVLDIELRHPDGPAGLARYTTALDSRLIHISGVHAAGYTYDALFRETGGIWQISSGDWWIANYNGRPSRLGHGRRMIAWQQNDGEVGPGPKRYAGIGQCDGDRLQYWYARRLAKERARRRQARH